MKGETTITPHDGGGTAEEVRARKVQQNNGFLHTLRKGEDWLDEKLVIETQGIDIIHEEDKRPPSILNVFLMWWSMPCHVRTIQIGILGPEFGLSLNQSVAGCVVGTFLGACCTAFIALGLRAIATSRYSFGFYGAKLASLLNIIIGGGFAVVNIVVVGQILSAVSDYKMTLAVGCLMFSLNASSLEFASITLLRDLVFQPPATELVENLFFQPVQ
ncbi:hypothetical protein BJ875DRAFT_489249 [Amylocarpus encephaloides]|uniref:Uncharacterized protein n=1 Tax=Amylocarpus encephaloides TaxID=45428 RepID=A0A9P7Y809_9HELO|nr:hypothetical protein BJ875DRAFT_489249 [Amylocarpus encephaloides]